MGNKTRRVMPLIAITILSFFYLSTFVRFRPRLEVDAGVSRRFQVRIIHDPIISMNGLKLAVLPKGDAVPAGTLTYAVYGLGGKVIQQGVLMEPTSTPPKGLSIHPKFRGASGVPSATVVPRPKKN